MVLGILHVVQQRRCADPEVSSTSKTSKRKIDTSSMLPIRTPDHSPRNFRHLTPCSKNGCNWEGPEQSNASKHFSHPPPPRAGVRGSLGPRLVRLGTLWNRSFFILAIRTASCALGGLCVIPCDGNLFYLLGCFTIRFSILHFLST
jgi:hypothetical protein